MEKDKVFCIECRRWIEEEKMKKIFSRHGIHLDQWEGICKECWNFDDKED
jgi:hypothetical protein